jgi:protein SCO1
MNRRAMTKLFIAPIALLLMLPLSLSGCDSSTVAPAPVETPPLAGSTIGGAFTLADKTGKPVRWDDFAGKYRIVYFGFTFCPDACPTDIAVLMQGLVRFEKAHGAAAANIQPIFISIDPARDTPAKVGEFAAAFSPRLLGLTGTAAQVDVAAKAFKVYYAKGNQSAGGYLMDHSRIAYLMDRDGKPLSMLPVDMGPDAVAADLAKWVK